MRRPIELLRSEDKKTVSSSSYSNEREVTNVKPMEIKPLSPPRRYIPTPQLGIEPPSIAEVERNITIFLRTLHTRLSELASPSINPIDALNAYMDVTKNTLLNSDDLYNLRYRKHRR